jgi:hypothetical protein
MDREILYFLLIGSVFLFFTVTFGPVFLSTELVTVTVVIIVAVVGGSCNLCADEIVLDILIPSLHLIFAQVCVIRLGPLVFESTTQRFGHLHSELDPLYLYSQPNPSGSDIIE